jgi:hypothetical protein
MDIVCVLHHLIQRPRRRLEDDIKMGLTETECEEVDWSHMTHIEISGYVS